MTTVTDRLSKLPGWARRHIAALEAENTRLRDALTGSSDGDASTAFLNNGFGVPRTPLGRHARVEFVLGEHTTVQVGVEERDGRTLDVSANEGILVQPWATNHVKIIAERPS